MVHVITTAIYAFLLIMPLTTCLWLLASARTIGRQQKKTPKLTLAGSTRLPSPSLELEADPRKTIKLNQPPPGSQPLTPQTPSSTDPSAALNLLKKRRPSHPVVNTTKHDPLSAMFQAIPKDSSDKLSSSAASSPQGLSPPTLPNKRRHSLGSSPTKQKPKPLPSSSSRPRSNSYTESKSRSSSQLDSTVEKINHDLITPIHTSLEGIHSRILAAYLHLCIRYGSIFVDGAIRAATFTSKITYLNILSASGKIDATTASVCEKLILDSEEALAIYTPISKQDKSSALHNFYRGTLLLWVAIVLQSETKPHGSGLSAQELAAIFFQTLSDVHQRHHQSTHDAVSKSVRVCLNAATTMLFENLSMLCEHDAEAVKLVTKENIIWAYPLRINQATAELLSNRFTTPDLSDNMAMTTLQSVVDNNFSGLLHNDQHAVMQRVNTDFIAEYDGHLSIELVKKTLKSLNDQAEYVTLNHPDIGKLYEQVQFRQAYIFAVRSETERFITDSFDEQNGQPDLNKIQYLHQILSEPKFSTLTSADQLVILGQADRCLTKRYQDKVSTNELSRTLQTLMTYASSISIKCKGIKTLSQRWQIRLDYVTLVRQESARLLTNCYDRRTNPMPDYDKLLYLRNIKSNPIFNTLNLDDQTAVLDKVKTILTERFANSPLSGTLVTTLQQLCSDTSDISIACRDIEWLYSQYIGWMPLSTHSPGP